MKIIFINILLLALFFDIKAQDKTDTDSVKSLSEIIVKAYESNRRLSDVPAAVSVVGKQEFNRFNNISVVSALNSLPGIRIEERSPGSYRLNIRGSSLRSPFGVRNVKIYYNDIPYTDPGGNTYFNQLGFYDIQSMEVLKGPGSSLYGAGTGGVVLIKSDLNNFNPGVSLNYTSGSFASNNLNTNFCFGKNDFQNTINYQHQTSDGYRDWTKMRRDIFTWDATLKLNEKQNLQAHFLYGDLFYQTPGALTKPEYDANDKASRPTVGATPGAMQSQAAIYQKTFLAGFTYTQAIASDFKNTTTFYGAYTNLKNPTFRNYEIRNEPHFGGRTIFQYNKQLLGAKFNLGFGAELQKGFFTQTDYKNKNGNPDSLQTNDCINNFQAFIFSQASLEFTKGWIFSAGASINKTNLSFTRLSVLPIITQQRNFNNEFAPRFSILKKLAANISVYGIISKGFSPPTTAEILPSNVVVNTNLNAEEGHNYELGTRGNFVSNKFYYDVDIFYYQLKNAIVQRRDINGADYFTNAGSTNQKGLETYFSYKLADNNLNFVSNARLWISDTWYDFHYGDFKQINSDYSGNKMPSVAPKTLAAGADVSLIKYLYANITYYYSDKIPLNDANTDYASSYNLLGVKVGYKNSFSKKINFEIFAGAENIFDEKYSLGNDINAAGGRYYNAAPGRNFYTGISFKFL